MKFGENLQGHITSEWRTQYIDYERLKEILYEFKESAPCPDSVDEAEISRHFKNASESFFHEIEKELQKVNLFFGEKLNEAARRFTQLKNDVELQQKREARQRQKSQQRKIQAKNEEKTNVGQNGNLRHRKTSAQTVTSPAKFLKIGSSNEDKSTVKTMKELKLAFTEFYLALVLIQNYQDLNFTGFRKILKKHDKLMESSAGSDWREKYVEMAPFYTNKQISNFISETEAIFINDLEGGDRSKAMKRLRVPPLDQKTKDYPRGVVFRVGLFTGMCFVSVAAVILSVCYYQTMADVLKLPSVKEGNMITAIRLYRPGFSIWLFLVFIGVNIWGWRTAGVNHVLIFEIDPREHLSHQHVLEIAAWLALTWLASILAFIYEPLGSVIPRYAHPIIFYAFILWFLINPIKIPGFSCYFKARTWLLRRCWRLLVPGAYAVEFADFWLADQMNSLASVFMDMEYLICFFIFDGSVKDGIKSSSSVQISSDYIAARGPGNGTMDDLVATPRMPTEELEEHPVCGRPHYGLRILLACWPAGIRFAQCIRRYVDSKKTFPHLTNAGKYSTTFFKVIFHALFDVYKHAIFRTLLIVSSVISSCYTLAWDLKMDWGFLERSVEHTLLREEIVYAHVAYYYLAILQDILLRFSWVVSMYLSTIVGPVQSEILSTFFGTCEIFRRFVWNFFRLENEHLNNCGEFRAVRDISVAPLREDDLTVLLRVMDSDSGFKNRQKSSANDITNSMGRDFQLGSSWQAHYFEEPCFDSMTSSDETVESLFGIKALKKHRKVSMGERFFRRKAAVRDIGRLSKMHKNAKSHVVSPLAKSDDFLKAGKAGEIIEQDSSELLHANHDK